MYILKDTDKHYPFATVSSKGTRTEIIDRIIHATLEEFGADEMLEIESKVTFPDWGYSSTFDTRLKEGGYPYEIEIEIFKTVYYE